MAIDIVDFPINSMVMFHSFVNVYQRVNLLVVVYLKHPKKMNRHPGDLRFAADFPMIPIPMMDIQCRIIQWTDFWRANERYRKELCNIVMQLLPASTQLLLLHIKKNSGGKHMCAMVIPPWLGLIMGTWSSTFMGDSNFRLWFITINYHPFSHSVLLLFLSYSCNVGPPNDS